MAILYACLDGAAASMLWLKIALSPWAEATMGSTTCTGTWLSPPDMFTNSVKVCLPLFNYKMPIRLCCAQKYWILILTIRQWEIEVGVTSHWYGAAEDTAHF
jgi:hypothetical protein